MSVGSLRAGSSTRSLILDAALMTFAEYTYNGTSMNLVADRAGIAVGTIYRHFPSKAALGNALFRQWKSRLGEALASGDDPNAPARQRFRGYWRALMRYAAEHAVAFAFLEHQQHEAYLDDESQAVSSRITEAAMGMIELGQRRGEIRPGDPAVLVALVYGAFVGLTKTVRSGTSIDDDQFTAAEEAVWQMLSGG